MSTFVSVSITLFTITLDFLVNASSIGPSVVGGLVVSPPTIRDEISSVEDNSSNTVVVVVVDTDNPSLNNGPLKTSVVGGVLNTGIVVGVGSIIQSVIFLNLPTLLLEPKISLVTILALYFAPSGTPEIVVIDIEDPAGIT